MAGLPFSCITLEEENYVCLLPILLASNLKNVEKYPNFNT